MPILTNIEHLAVEQHLESGFFLCLIATNKIPPHIAIIANGKYYSVSVRGVKIAVDYQSLLKTIHHKKIPSLFIQLAIEPNFQALKKAYGQYPKLTEKESCLFPIRDYFQKEQLTTENWEFVFNAVDDLLFKNMVVQSYHLFMEDLLKARSFRLKEYTKSEIIALIKELKALC
ncbi:MAG: hypothetical protein N4A35_01585 [Flavobacteriales bacterium]|jgi:hypothetical protein|nr:hypothetical protein [Flavobacteriales bacterium]